jgi:2-C-methyl-D-erythritol 4-phosphate cytidylyltransferase/2-C-methyl-D-erythritol 2,4-cyclodiphosphate synthase
VAAVVLADGEIAGEPLAFVRVLDRTLLALCTETLDACPEIQGFVVVAPPGVEDRAADAARASTKFLTSVPGRPTRPQSVADGVDALPLQFHIVVCHDVARPLASPALFGEVLRGLDGADAAVPRVPVADTVKRVADGLVQQTIPREALGMLQTPQAFRRQALVTANRNETGDRDAPTDVVPFPVPAGIRVATVPGDPANFAVRSPGDLRLAERLLADRLSRRDGR